MATKRSLVGVLGLGARPHAWSPESTGLNGFGAKHLPLEGLELQL